MVTGPFKPNSRYWTTFYTPGGQTGRWLHRQAKMVETIAKAEVHTDTGRLKKSIKTGRVHVNPETNLEVEVGADAKTPGSSPPASYAYVHHEGSKPHVITAAPGKALHWGGRRGPTVMAVHHPGTKANPFLMRGLRLIMRRHKV